MDETKTGRRTYLFVGIVAAISTWLFFRCASGSLDFNESHNLLYAISRTPAELLKIDDMHPPGFYLLMHFWEIVAGRSEVLLRLPSLVFAIISIALVYLVGKRVYSEKVALIGALLFAVSPMQVMISSWARCYSLLTLAFLVSLLCFINILKENRNSYHAVNSAATFVALFIHYYGGFLPAYQLLYLLLGFRQRKAQIKKWLVFQGAVAVIYLPFAYIAVTYQLRMVNPIGGAYILTFGRFVNLLYAMSPLAQTSYLAVTPWVVLIMVFFTGLVIIGMYPLGENVLCAEYLIFPIVTVAAISNVTGLKFYQPYHLTFLLPIFTLLAARGLVKLGKVGVAAAALVVVPALILPLRNSDPDWRACSDYLQKNTRVDDAVIVLPELNDGLLYYWPRANIVSFDDIEPGRSVPRRVWAVFVYEGIYSTADATDLMTDWFKQAGFSAAPVNENIRNVKVILFSRGPAFGQTEMSETG